MSGNAMSAKMLQTSSSAISAYSCIKLFESQPELKESYGDQAFDYWKDFIGQLTRDLSVAVKEEKPEILHNKINWEREAFQARGVNDSYIFEALKCLNEVVGQELPGAIAGKPQEFLDLAQEAFENGATKESQLEAKDPVSKLASSYLLKILEGDAHGAIEMVVDARSTGMSLESVYLALTQAQAEVGRMWHVAEISIAEEHLITHTTHRAMSVLNFQTPRPELNGKTIVSSAVEGNYHDLGIRAVTDFFEFVGWRVICLGHDTPADEIAQAAQVFDASLVMLSASMGAHLDSARRTVQLIKERKPDCKILLGGKIFADFPDLASEIGGDGSANGLQEAVDLGNRLCGVEQ